MGRSIATAWTHTTLCRSGRRSTVRVAAESMRTARGLAVGEPSSPIPRTAVGRRRGTPSLDTDHRISRTSQRPVAGRDSATAPGRDRIAPGLIVSGSMVGRARAATVGLAGARSDSAAPTDARAIAPPPMNIRPRRRRLGRPLFGCGRAGGVRGSVGLGTLGMGALGMGATARRSNSAARAGAVAGRRRDASGWSSPSSSDRTAAGRRGSTRGGTVLDNFAVTMASIVVPGNGGWPVRSSCSTDPTA